MSQCSSNTSILFRLVYNTMFFINTFEFDNLQSLYSNDLYNLIGLKICGTIGIWSQKRNRSYN